MIEVRAGGLDDTRVVDLLRFHLDQMARYSPPGSVHALDIDALRAIGFWTAREGDAVLGCGALKALDADHGELKSMRTAPDHLRRGVAAILLTHIIAAARASGHRRLSLETGSGPAFEPGHALYRRFGFEECGPFGDYRASGFNRFMSRAI